MIMQLAADPALRMVEAIGIVGIASTIAKVVVENAAALCGATSKATKTVGNVAAVAVGVGTALMGIDVVPVEYRDTPVGTFVGSLLLVGSASVLSNSAARYTAQKCGASPATVNAVGTAASVAAGLGTAMVGISVIPGMS